ncbi:SHOCT domain-containing protein [Catellatospora sp. NPDC049609]|uniref:SHOCT domain-containing protein n=1 Tax=Catellatospora sp. NPDC049609 TaxID=3155505 RepID=UPI0034421793
MLRRPPVVRRGPGLLGTVARTAVVAGTASATAGAVCRWSDRRQQAAAQEEAARQAVHEQQEEEPPPASAAGAELMAQLQQLAELKAAGALTGAEFAAAKAKLLGT